MTLTAVRPTTAGDAFSAIFAKALPICRRVAMLFSSYAKADSGAKERNVIKIVEITK